MQSAVCTSGVYLQGSEAECGLIKASTNSGCNELKQIQVNSQGENLHENSRTFMTTASKGPKLRPTS